MAEPQLRFPSHDFTATVAIIVGASRGIGAGAALAWARAGAAVVLAARDEVALDAVAREITDSGGRALAVPTDVTDDRAVAALVDVTLGEFGRLDFAFNNATGGTRPTPITEVSPDDFDAALAPNVRGTFLGLHYEIPAIIASGGGAIVNMASMAGVQGVGNLSAYVAGKAAIIGLTKVAALEYADQGVRVNVVAPGPILTHHLEAAGERAQQQAGQATPMRRVGTVAEVAATVLWLCSPAAGFITGVTLPIDGGQSAGTLGAARYTKGQPMEEPSD